MTLTEYIKKDGIESCNMGSVKLELNELHSISPIGNGDYRVSLKWVDGNVFTYYRLKDISGLWTINHKTGKADKLSVFSIDLPDNYLYTYQQ